MISDIIPDKISTIERCIRGLAKIMQMIIEKHLGDFQQYAKQVLAYERTRICRKGIT